VLNVWFLCLGELAWQSKGFFKVSFKHPTWPGKGRTSLAQDPNVPSYSLCILIVDVG
jgi:hypothetical protein